MAGSNLFFCSMLPPSKMAEAPMTEVASKGEAASARPVSSSTMPMPGKPNSSPPYCSGRMMPGQPNSAISRHKSGE